MQHLQFIRKQWFNTIYRSSMKILNFPIEIECTTFSNQHWFPPMQHQFNIHTFLSIRFEFDTPKYLWAGKLYVIQCYQRLSISNVQQIYIDFLLKFHVWINFDKFFFLTFCQRIFWKALLHVPNDVIIERFFFLDFFRLLSLKKLFFYFLYHSKESAMFFVVVQMLNKKKKMLTSTWSETLNILMVPALYNKFIRNLRECCKFVIVKRLDIMTE